MFNARKVSNPMVKLREKLELKNRAEENHELVG